MSNLELYTIRDKESKEEILFTGRPLYCNNSLALLFLLEETNSKVRIPNLEDKKIEIVEVSTGYVVAETSINNELSRFSQRNKIETHLVQTYGIHKQTLIACEEFGELIQAASKTLRGGYGLEHLIEEIADAEIMMEQLEIFYGISRESIDENKDFKLQRQMERLSKSKEEEFKHE